MGKYPSRGIFALSGCRERDTEHEFLFAPLILGRNWRGMGRLPSTTFSMRAIAVEFWRKMNYECPSLSSASLILWARPTS